VAGAEDALGAGVMMEKFAAGRGLVVSEFLDLNRTRKVVVLVSLMFAKFAPEPGIGHWRTSQSGH
jgi:hypothetical protein